MQGGEQAEPHRAQQEMIMQNVETLPFYITGKAIWTTVPHNHRKGKGQSSVGANGNSALVSTYKTTVSQPKDHKLIILCASDSHTYTSKRKVSTKTGLLLSACKTLQNMDIKSTYILFHCFSEKEIENIINMLFHWTCYPLRTLIQNEQQ